MAKAPTMASNTVVRRLDAIEGETVEIRWWLRDGGEFHQRVTIPPKATREVREPASQGQPVQPDGAAD